MATLPLRLLCALAMALSSVTSSAQDTLRLATYNVSMYRSTSGKLAQELAAPGSAQPAAIAEVIQRVDPDVILLNEFDFDAAGQAIAGFCTHYLGVSQRGLSPVHYPYVFQASSNTGIQPEDVLGPEYDCDFDKNGAADDPADAFGYGQFPGQYGMVVLSKYPIRRDAVRTFQQFRWKDMPEALLPDNPQTVGVDRDYYNQQELRAVRLSSKSHWDLPIDVGGRILHLLASHPTPPVFDGPEDRNGRRNHDEIRFWADYIDPAAGSYIYDDAEFAAAGNTTPARPSGGLREGQPFVIVGDLNADPDEGDSWPNAARQLTANPRVADFVPQGQGGPEIDDTASFGGGLRVDYALPSITLRVAGGGVFWPQADDPQFAASRRSDHRLVSIDLHLPLGGHRIGE